MIKRSIGIDLVKILAMYLVILVHSTSFYGFYKIDSLVMFGVGFFRYLSFTCVPLFMMITGYLLSKRKPTKQHYIKLLPTVIEYLLCCIVVLSFRIFYAGEVFTLKTIIFSIIEFHACPYGWYVAMFIGLYLFAPMLNMIYDNIDKKYHMLFLISLIAFFAWPYESYWKIAYPLMYYYIGVFINNKQCKVFKLYPILILIVSCTLATLLSMSVSFRWHVENHSNIFCVISTVCLFLLLYNLFEKSDKEIVVIKKGLQYVAMASLSTFLISYIFEYLTLQYFNKCALYTFEERLPSLMWITPVKFVISIMGAIVINQLALLIWRLMIVFYKRMSSKRAILSNNDVNTHENDSTCEK